ncbi:MAG: 23S rRNA (adenine(2503)-C(2))-methyltransferase RlmN, partial [Oscillospiraceae bacterium]|nr:23S rRNA (adenine(2503)-C(2))-methyltransferase RlmN [Oscillospiraceae bacterium]
MEKVDIKSLDMQQLTEYVISMGLKSFNAKQIYSWLHQKNAESFDEMTNLSKTVREQLGESCTLTKLEIAQKQVSKDGTIKYLYR